MRLVNQNFFNSFVGPGADTMGGFYEIEYNSGGSAYFGVGGTGRTTGSALQIVSDSRSFDSTSGRTLLIGYDDRPLSQLSPNDIVSSNPSTNLSSYPLRIQDGDSWWYSFSLMLPGTVWTKGALYEPIIWQMTPIQPGGTTTYGLKPPVSFAIDYPGTVNVNSVSSWYTTTATPHLYFNTLLPALTGTDGLFNNLLNYQYGDLGQLSFNTWYDIKLLVHWSATYDGSASVWIKTSSTKSFPATASYTVTNIQTVAQVNSVPVEGFLRVGFDAQLNMNSSNNYMQNTLYLDNILAGNNVADVDLYPADLDISGSIVFDGGWDGAGLPGSMTDANQVLNPDWTGYFAAPNGSAIVGTADAQYAISVVNDNTYNSPYAARFELRPGDSDGFFERAEVQGTVIPFAGGTGGFSWSTYFDSSWDVNSTTPTYFWRMLRNGSPNGASMFGLYAANGTVYLEINRYIGATAMPIVAWGTAIDSFGGVWTNFKLQMQLGTASGSAALWINNVQQTMNYPLGIGNGSGGLNTLAYSGPTLQTGGSGIYPSMGIKRIPDPDMGTPILWHDNFKITH